MAARDFGLMAVFVAFSTLALGGVPQEITNHPCLPEIKRLLGKMGSFTHWTLEAAGDVSVYRAPSSIRGTWVEIHMAGDNHVTLLQSNDAGVTRYRWSPVNCKREFSFRKPSYAAKKLDGRFSDAVLGQILKKHRAGVIFAWSPHMPLSVEGISLIEKIAGELKLSAFFVLDPHADAVMAKQVPKIKGKQEYLRRIESTELFRRGLKNHYPALLYFEDGNLSHWILPGLQSELVYRKFIAERAKKR